MSSICKNQRLLCPLVALIVLSVAAYDCQAQQNEQSLFVIKTPAVNTSAYGKQPNAIRFAKLAAQEEETPTEDLGDGERALKFNELKEDDDLMKDIKKLGDMASEDDENLLEELDDDRFDEEDSPPARPMTTWNLKPMSSISPGMRPVKGASPADQSWQLTSRGTMPLANSQKLFAWAAPDIKYNPLYFEDVALERYGQTRGVFRQPFASGLHFLKSATFLPYYTLYDPINACDGPLGYCRPGVRVNCASQKHYFGNPFAGRR